MNKRILLLLTSVLALTWTGLFAREKSSSVRSSTLKIGYTNEEYILSFLPELKTIESEYTSFEKQLQKQLETKLDEFQQKVQNFQQGYETMAEAVKEQKQAELEQLQKSLQRLQLESQEKLSTKRANLLKPIYEKITKAIAQVAKENNYTHIFNDKAGSIPLLLYVDEKHEADNISERVLEKLGLNPKKENKKK